jgi:ribosome-binding factor A
MDSTRQQKVSRLLQKEMAEMFQRELTHLFHGKMVTLTVVRISPDLSVARVYLSIFPPAARQETLDVINENTVSIRHRLGQRIRQQLRIVPELHFFIDDSIDYYENIDNLLKK